MKRLLLISPVSGGSLMGQGFFFRFPSLGLNFSFHQGVRRLARANGQGR